MPQGSVFPFMVVNVDYYRPIEKMRTDELNEGSSRTSTQTGLQIWDQFTPTPSYQLDHTVILEIKLLQPLGYPFKLMFWQHEETKGTKVYFNDVQFFQMRGISGSVPCVSGYFMFGGISRFARERYPNFWIYRCLPVGRSMLPPWFKPSLYF